MKIAVCYSGCLRTFPKCFEKNHEVISRLGTPDYYISTWNRPGYTMVDRINDYLAIGGDTVYDDLLGPDDEITSEYLMSMLPFNEVDIQSMDIMNDVINSYLDRPWHIMHPARLISQYYKMRRSFELVKGDYDACLRIRPDVTIDNLPNLSELHDTIYLNSNVYNGLRVYENREINEMVYLSDMENMRKLCNITQNFDSLWNPHDAYGERMSYLNLAKESILWKCVPFSYGITVVRENGDDEYM